MTVTLLVYPVLAATPPHRWDEAHARHTRRITPLVALVYLPLAAASATAAWRLVDTAISSPASLADGPAATLLTCGIVLALLGAAGAAAATAFGAAPTHGALGRGYDPQLLARLTRYDRWRCAAAVAGGAGAVLAACAAAFGG